MNLAVTTPPKLAESIIHTNLLGTIYCCQQISPLMMRMKQGSIINFSTIAVKLGLNHPITKQRLEFEAPLPEQFQKLLLILRKRYSHDCD